METKRQVFDEAIAYLTTATITGSMPWLERYDNALDDAPGNVITYDPNSASTFVTEPPRPSVHEIAMHLAAAVIARGVIDQADPKFVYKVAQELYNAGTEWEQDKTKETNK